MIQIREATLDDLEILLDLWTEFSNYLNQVEPDFFQPKANAKEIYRQILNSQLIDDHVLVVIAFFDGTPIGYHITSICYPKQVFIQEPYGHISDLYLKAEYRGEKLGQRLVDFSLKWLESNQISKVSVKPFLSKSQAISFWQKNDFKPYEVVLKHIICKD